MAIDEEIAKELAKQIPIKSIYKEGLSPAVKQSGQLAADIVKTIQLALAPVQILGAYQDRLRTFIDRSVRRVPAERRISPAPQLLGPIIEGVRYEQEGTPIDEMYSTLLGCSMDKERVGEAHPAFPILIKQLSSDEVKLLNGLYENQYSYVMTQDYDRAKNWFSNGTVESHTLPLAELAYPENYAFYLEHLEKLGLTHKIAASSATPIFAPGKRDQIGLRSPLAVCLTRVGHQFVAACTNPTKGAANP